MFLSARKRLDSHFIFYLENVELKFVHLFKQMGVYWVILWELKERQKKFVVLWDWKAGPSVFYSSNKDEK
ncbi:hypothetical protein SLA2020_210010 [Shorea laevis]